MKPRENFNLKEGNVPWSLSYFPWSPHYDHQRQCPFDGGLTQSIKGETLSFWFKWCDIFVEVACMCISVSQNPCRPNMLKVLNFPILCFKMKWILNSWHGQCLSWKTAKLLFETKIVRGIITSFLSQIRPTALQQYAPNYLISLDLSGCCFIYMAQHFQNSFVYLFIRVFIIL